MEKTNKQTNFKTGPIGRRLAENKNKTKIHDSQFGERVEFNVLDPNKKFGGRLVGKSGRLAGN